MNTKRTLLLALALTLPLAGATAITITTNTAVSPGDLTYDGAAIIVSNCTLTVNGPHSFASLALQQGAVLTHSPAPAGEPDNRLDLTIAGNLVVDATSRIDANAKGFAPLAGPGTGLYDYYYPSGGGHGGPGGNGYGVAGGGSYGALLSPTSWGSGGGNMSGNSILGGAGGGRIRLEVAGTLAVDGQLTANGQSVWAGAGAGGSVHIIAGELAGAGSITADGGHASYVLAGGGGGGRVALYYGHSTFSGVLTALGGISPEAGSGGVGTVYAKANGQTVGDLLLNNTGRTNAVESPLTAPVAYRLTLSNATAYANVPLTLSGLRVGNKSLLTHPFQGPRLQVTVHGNAVVEGGGAVAAIARGYPSHTGPGHGNCAEGSSGAGHGGLGGSGWGAGPGGVTYGSMTEPVDFGSGGGCGPVNRGGGAIQLSVDGTLTIDGTVSADADQGNCGNCWDGGGSGGSVWLTTGRLNGGGSITANGQLATYPLSGSGGGGRIAIYAGVNQFLGTVWASGGKSADRPGHDGTTYVTNVPPGLVSWWPGENSGADRIGSNNLTPYESVGYAPGLVGTAFALGGGYFEAPWSPNFYFKWGETAMTFECWVYNQTTYLPFHIVGVRNDSGDQSKWQIGYDSSYNTTPPPLNQWSHVAIAIETDRFVVYLNGQPDWVYPNPQWGTDPNTGTPFRLGTSASWAPFRGLLDEARYYSRALSSSEIAVLYATHTSETPPPPTLSVAATSGGVLLSWPATYTDYGLVSRSDLTPGTWDAVTNTPALNGPRKEVVLPANGSKQFFRLIRQ